MLIESTDRGVNYSSSLFHIDDSQTLVSSLDKSTGGSSHRLDSMSPRWMQFDLAGLEMLPRRVDHQL